MRRFKTLDDLPADLTGKKLLVRVDLNVPMEGAKVTDDTRLRAMLPTILELTDRGAFVLLLVALRTAKGEKRPDMSTAQLVLPVHQAARGGRFVSSRIAQGPEAQRAIATMPRVISASLKTRVFTPARKRTTPRLPRPWRRLAIIYVNDAFSAAHRAHASTEGHRPLAPELRRPRDGSRAQGAASGRSAIPSGQWRRWSAAPRSRPSSTCSVTSSPRSTI